MPLGSCYIYDTLQHKRISFSLKFPTLEWNLEEKSSFRGRVYRSWHHHTYVRPALEKHTLCIFRFSVSVWRWEGADGVVEDAFQAPPKLKPVPFSRLRERVLFALVNLRKKVWILKWSRKWVSNTSSEFTQRYKKEPSQNCVYFHDSQTEFLALRSASFFPEQSDLRKQAFSFWWHFCSL